MSKCNKDRPKSKVTIIGGGTVGYRLLQTMMHQPDIQVVGITKRNLEDADGHYLTTNYPDHTFPIQFLDDLLDASDIAVDCTDKASHELMPKYKEHGVKVILQGGEQRGQADRFFNSYTDFHEGKSCQVLQVNSCNDTNFIRLAYALRDLPIAFSVWSLCRRGADPKQSKKGPINAVMAQTDTHHARDVNQTLQAQIISNAYKASFTEMHVQTPVFACYEKVTPEDIADRLESVPRIVCVTQDRFPSTAELREYGRKLAHIPGRFGDIYESVVWKDQISVNPVVLRYDALYMISIPSAVHQEAIIVPENIDAVRSLAGGCCKHSLRYTDFSLAIGKGW